MIFDNIVLINLYIPTVGLNLQRLKFKTEVWQPALLRKLQDFEATGKCVLTGGDLNITHTSRDFCTDLKTNSLPATTKEERLSFHRTFRNQYEDVFRNLHPQEPGYTFFDKMFGKWRLDYFYISTFMKSSISSMHCRGDIKGSDHIPIILTLSPHR